MDFDLNPNQMRELHDALTATITADDFADAPGAYWPKENDERYVDWSDFEHEHGFSLEAGDGHPHGEPHPAPQATAGTARPARRLNLMIERRDGGGWALPDGHIEPGAKTAADPAGPGADRRSRAGRHSHRPAGRVNRSSRSSGVTATFAGVESVGSGREIGTEGAGG